MEVMEFGLNSALF